MPTICASTTTVAPLRSHHHALPAQDPCQEEKGQPISVSSGPATPVIKTHRESHLHMQAFLTSPANAQPSPVPSADETMAAAPPPPAQDRRHLSKFLSLPVIRKLHHIGGMPGTRDPTLPPPDPAPPASSSTATLTRTATQTSQNSATSSTGSWGGKNWVETFWERVDEKKTKHREELELVVALKSGDKQAATRALQETREWVEGPVLPMGKVRATIFERGWPIDTQPPPLTGSLRTVAEFMVGQKNVRRTISGSWLRSNNSGKPIWGTLLIARLRSCATGWLKA